MGKTLLLADDSVTIQKVVGISFASEDIQIITVDNGDAALVKARELRPDVILADVVMPGKSGYEVCEAIHADAELRHIPVLLLTGTFEAFDEERARRAGAAGHVAKPFEAQTLVERVKELLTRRATAPPPPPAASAPPAAPQRAASPPPVHAAAPPAASGSDQAFDFFDDAPETPPQATRIDLSASTDDALPLESGDDAFAFGEDEFAVAPAPRDRNDVSAQTIAMLPDEPAARPAAQDRAVPSARAPAETSRAGAARPAAKAADEGFDFEFESVAGGSEDAELAEAALLDPAGDSAFDVSASDLGDLVASVPAHAVPAAPTRILSMGDEVDDFEALGAEEDASDAWSADPGSSGRALAAADASARAADASTANTDPVWGSPSRSASGPVSPGFIEEAPTAPPLHEAPPASGLSFAEEEDDGDGFLLAGEPTALEPPAAAPRTAPEAGASRGLSAEALLAEIGPSLRTQLHETLEKVAWESFGQVTEQLVEQALERVEKVAWEVVPKLAEALILEEIRKLKGSADD